MSSPPPAGEAVRSTVTLVSSWIVGPLYGINVCVFILCVRVLYTKGLKGASANIIMLVVASVQFALATGHFITFLVMLIRAFVDEANIPNGTWLYLTNQAIPERIAQEGFYITNSLIGDAILIWRLWIIWDRSFWLSLPFILLYIATGVSGYVALVNLARLAPMDTIFAVWVHNWLITTWSLSIATQVGATLLIGYRFWRSMKWRSSTGSRAPHLAGLWILVESGAIYSLNTVFVLAFLSKPKACCTGVVFVAMLGQISALCPTLIIVRAGLRSSSSSSALRPVKGSINKSHESLSRNNSGDVESSGQGGDGMVVHVKRATEFRLKDLEPCDSDASISKGGTHCRNQGSISPSIQSIETHRHSRAVSFD